MVHLRWQGLPIDPLLLIFVFLLVNVGLFILFSASNQNVSVMLKQTVWLLIRFFSHVYFCLYSS